MHLEEERRKRFQVEERDRLEELKFEEERIEKIKKETENERIKREEKIINEKKIKLICDNLTNLKLKLNEVGNYATKMIPLDEQMIIIAESERELNHLNSQLEKINTDGLGSQPINNSVGFTDNLTTFDLVKSFVQFLQTQVNDKQKEVMHKQNLKLKLDESIYNLQQYKSLAFKILNEQETNSSYVQSLSDLQEKIKSIHMIEDSVHKCIREIDELDNMYQFHQNDKINIDLNEIRENTLKPLHLYATNLEEIESQWNLFDTEFTLLKTFLKHDIEYENIVNNKDSIIIQDVNYELNKYNKVKQHLINKLPSIKETLNTGLKLFDTKLCSPKFKKEINEMKDAINDTLTTIDNKLVILNMINMNNDKAEILDKKLNIIKSDLYSIEINENDNNLRNNLAELIELKKHLKQIQIEKDLMENEFEIELNTNLKVLNINETIYQQKFQSNLGQHTETINSLNKQIDLLESKYQKDLLKVLPSRNAITELNSWIKEKAFCIKELSKSIQPQNSTIGELDTYMRQLQDLNDEMVQKESTLEFVRESIETEIKQGFYDLNVCEHSRVLEQDWLKLKQDIQMDLERLDVVFQKINEFNKDIYEIENWIIEQNEKHNKDDDSNDLDVSNVFDEQKNEDDKINKNERDSFMTKIGNNKIILDRIEQINKLNPGYNKNDNDTLKYKPIAENYIEKKLEELKSNLMNLEKYTNLKRENSLTKIKQKYFTSIHDIIANIKREVNFLNHGRLLTLHQYESSIDNILNLQLSLDDLYEEMISKFKNYIEKQIDSSNNEISLNEYLNELNYEETKKVLEEVIHHANIDILPLWKNFNNLAKEIDEQFGTIHSNILQANVHLQNHAVSPLQNSYGNDCNATLIPKFEEFLRNIDMQTHYDKITNIDNNAKQLIESVTNLNTKQQLIQHLDFIHEQHSNLCNLVQNLHNRYEELCYEQKVYEDLVEKTSELIKEAKQIIDLRIDDLDNFDSNRTKSILNLIRDAEINIRNNIDKFRKLHIQDGQRMQKLCEIVTTADETIKNLYLKQSQLLDHINEKKYKIQLKINEIKLFINTYENRRNYLKTLELSKQKVDLNPYLEILDYIQDNKQKLNEYLLILDDLLHAILIKNQNDDLCFDNQDEAEVKSLMEKLNFLIKQIDVIRNSGFLENFRELNEIIEKFEQINNLTDKENEKSIQIKLLYSRFNELKRMLMSNIETFSDLNIQFLENIHLKHILDRIENEFNFVLKDAESLLDKLHKYRTLSVRIDQQLIDIEEKMNKREAFQLSSLQKSIANSVLIEKSNEPDNLESQLNYFSQLKKYLYDEQFKIDLDTMHKLGCELDRQRKYGNFINADIRMMLMKDDRVTSFSNKDILKTIEYLPNHEALRIKYLDLTYRLDIKMKELESEFTNWKFIAKKSRRLLDLIKKYHEILSTITKNTNKYVSDNSQTNKYDISEVNGKCFANKTDINRILNSLKRDILTKLESYEYLKDEIVNLSSKSTIKSFLIKDIVDKIINEWDLLINRVKNKIVKIEKLSNKLIDLDSNLYNLRQEIFVIEIYLNNDCFYDLNLNKYKDILSKKQELEELLNRLYSQDESVTRLFKYCTINTHNRKLVLCLHERWQKIKLTITEKILELQNIWLHICDLNEQIERFNIIWTKTNNFYLNTLLTMTSNNLNLIKFIEHLYSTIKDDDKLIKYLNQSYICLIKMTIKFPLFHQNENFKQRIMFLNSKWDDLHNEIAIKIKGVFIT